MYRDPCVNPSITHSNKFEQVRLVLSVITTVSYTHLDRQFELLVRGGSKEERQTQTP